MKPDIEIWCPSEYVEDIVRHLLGRHKYPMWPKDDEPHIWCNVPAPAAGRPVYRYAFVVDGREPQGATKGRRGDPRHPKWVYTASGDITLTTDMMMHEIAEDTAFRLISDGTS